VVCFVFFFFFLFFFCVVFLFFFFCCFCFCLSWVFLPLRRCLPSVRVFALSPLKAYPETVSGRPCPPRKNSKGVPLCTQLVSFGFDGSAILAYYVHDVRAVSPPLRMPSTRVVSRPYHASLADYSRTRIGLRGVDSGVRHLSTRALCRRVPPPPAPDGLQQDLRDPVGRGG